MTDLYCGAGAAFTSFVLAGQVESIAGQIIVSVFTALLFVGVRILTSYLENKGIINDHQKHEIDKVADDLLDDGKINNSNLTNDK